MLFAARANEILVTDNFKNGLSHQPDSAFVKLDEAPAGALAAYKFLAS